MTNGRIRIGCAALAVALAMPAAAQDPPRPPTPSEVAGQDDAQQELRKLFAKVERTLRRIDRELAEAAAGEVPLGLPEDSGIADLLRESQGRSQRAIRDIDRILEIASKSQSRPQAGEGQDSQQPPPPSDSPLDQPRSQQPQHPETTPELPGGQEPQGAKPEETDGQPDGPEATDDTPENSPNSEPPQSDAGPGQADTGGAGRWGELPARVREIFRSQGGGDLPVQYRDWIDSYYRRLNRSQ